MDDATMREISTEYWTTKDSKLELFYGKILSSQAS